MPFNGIHGINWSVEMAKSKKKPEKRKMTTSQIVMGVIGILIILSMVIGMFQF
jgi:hypothetical protein